MFVVPLADGSLDREQKLITKKGEVADGLPPIARNFEQYVYRRQI